MAIVRSSSVEELAVEVTADAVTGEPQVDVVWKDDRLDATVGGRSKALIETHNVIIPDQRDAIAGVADELRAVVNGVHMAGYDEAGVGGIEFFVGVAGQLPVTTDIVDNPTLHPPTGVPCELERAA